MSKRTVAALLLAALASASCGIKDDLQRTGNRVGVAIGGLDPALIGTFRLHDSTSAAVGMLRLVVLRTDYTFHAQLIAACDDPTCPESSDVVIEGEYRQFRELPDPSKANGVALTADYVDPATGEPRTAYIVLRRAWIEGSPKLGLYHLQEGTDENARPFFLMAHPVELWCAGPSDCQLQLGECGAPFTCSQAQCRCD